MVKALRRSAARIPGAFLLPALVIIPLFLGRLQLDDTRMKRETVDRPRPVFAYIPRPDFARGLAAGHELALADLVEIATINYACNPRRDRPEQYAFLARLFNLVVALDPDNTDAYLWASTFLTVVSNQPRRAELILHKGEKRFGGRLADPRLPPAGRVLVEADLLSILDEEALLYTVFLPDLGKLQGVTEKVRAIARAPHLAAGKFRPLFRYVDAMGLDRTRDPSAGRRWARERFVNDLTYSRYPQVRQAARRGITLVDVQGCLEVLNRLAGPGKTLDSLIAAYPEERRRIEEEYARRGAALPVLPPAIDPGTVRRWYLGQPLTRRAADPEAIRAHEELCAELASWAGGSRGFSLYRNRVRHVIEDRKIVQEKLDEASMAFEDRTGVAAPGLDSFLGLASFDADAGFRSAPGRPDPLTGAVLRTTVFCWGTPFAAVYDPESGTVRVE